MSQVQSPVDFSLADGHGYILDRSHLSTSRLNLQHYLWKEALKFVVHPSVRLPKNPAIADVACGTGLWLVEAAERYPSGRLHGFDVSLSQAAHPAWLPSNVRLSRWDIFDEVPAEWVGKFDLVHVRLLVLVLSGHDPQATLKNLLRLLKPGGYLQWDELDHRAISIRKVEPSLQTPALDEMVSMCHSDGRHDWTLRIPELLWQEGCRDVKRDRYEDPTALVRAYSDMHMVFMEEFAVGMLRVGEKDAGGEVFRLVRRAFAECVEGAAFCVPKAVCTARKGGGRGLLVQIGQLHDALMTLLSKSVAW